MKNQDKRSVSARCGNCRFWLKSEPTKGQTDSENFGECKRYPPVWATIDGDTTQVSPLVGSIDFCGEFRIRVDA